MSYYVGDDATMNHAVTATATAPGTLTFTPVVTASKYDDTTVSVAGAAWLGDPAATRDLEFRPPASRSAYGACA